MNRRLILPSCLCVLVGFLGMHQLTYGDDNDSQVAVKPYQPPGVATEKWTDERLVKFMRELTEFVYKNHVVTETDAVTYGMTYEWYDPKHDRRIQGFGLDSMHDGAWFTAAMMTAERADPKGDYLEQALKYQIPFYVNMINHADQLFPKQSGGSPNVTHETPLKGWVPRGWDSGLGSDLKGNKFKGITYLTPSNHLSQDLADMLLNVWLTTRSPMVAQAAVNLDQERVAAFGRPIGPVRHAAKVATGKATPPPVSKDWSPASWGRDAYPGLYLQKKSPVNAGGDNQGWATRQAISDAVLRDGDFSPATAWSLAWRTYSAMVALEFYFDDHPLQYGMTVGGDHGAGGGVTFVAGTGRLQDYRSDGKRLVDARGVTSIWPGAALLPVLRKHKDVWERPYRKNHADDTLVRIVDNAPKTDGKRDKVYSQSQSVGPDAARVTLISDPKNLHVLIEASQAKVHVALKHTAKVEGKKRVGVIEASADGDITAVNDRGEKLLHASAFQKTGSGWVAELCIPYTAVREQKPWINGVDHGRYDVQVNGGKARIVYMLSTPDRVIERLVANSVGTVETWHKVWKERGTIPWVLTRRQWNDAGHNAQLIHLIAYILMDRAGTPEWELIRRNEPKSPKQFALPASVLKAQGLIK